MHSIHGHKVLAMMEGNSYTPESLLSALNAKFGDDAKFHTCSKQAMSAKELIEFLAVKGKFKPYLSAEFTVDSDKICDHH